MASMKRLLASCSASQSTTPLPAQAPAVEAADAPADQGVGQQAPLGPVDGVQGSSRRGNHGTKGRVARW